MAKKNTLLKKIREHLDEGEQVLQSVTGAYATRRLGQNTLRKGILVATDKKLAFYGKKTFGFEFEMIPFSKISSVEIKKGLMGWSISLYTSSNTIKMKYIHEAKDAQDIVEYVRSRVGDTVPTQSNSADTSLDQITRLHEMKEAGIITVEEFELKKGKLL